MAVGEAARIARAMANSSREGLSAQAAMKAAAVERLTPAKQWITIGSARSQAWTKPSRSSRCVMLRQDLAGHRLDDIGDGEIKMPLGPDLDRALDISAGAQQGDERAERRFSRRFRRSEQANTREGEACGVSLRRRPYKVAPASASSSAEPAEETRLDGGGAHRLEVGGKIARSAGRARRTVSSPPRSRSRQAWSPRHRPRRGRRS